MATRVTRYVRLANVLQLEQRFSPALTSRSFVTGWVASKEDKGTMDSVAHAVGDAVEETGKNLRDSAKESSNKESGSESNISKQMKSAAESVGDATADAGHKIEHSLDSDDKESNGNTRLNKKNLEDKDVLSN